MTEFWYRYEDVRYASSLDDYRRLADEGELCIHLRKFEVIRVTAKGVWLNAWHGPCFVLRDARKRYACPTVEEAKESFIARKERQLGIYRARARKAEQALLAAKNDIFEKAVLPWLL